MFPTFASGARWLWKGWPLVRMSAAYVGAIVIGWEMVWLLCGRYAPVEALLGLSIPVGLGLGLLTSIKRRTINVSMRAASGPIVASGLAAFGIVMGIHLWPETTGRYGFLDPKATEMKLAPGYVDYVRLAYTFPDELESVFQRASAEMVPSGYHQWRPKKGSTLVLVGDQSNQISFTPGRAVEKHTSDADEALVVEEAKGWVTVEVFVQHPLGPIRMIAP